MIVIISKKKKVESIGKEYSDAIVADVTNKVTDGQVRINPFYPHGDNRIPFSEDHKAVCIGGNARRPRLIQLDKA